MKTAWEKELLTPIDRLFFTLVGILASLILTFLYYWGLRIDSSLYSFVINTRSEPVYYWIYLLLTSGSVVLFGINIAFLVFRVRKYGFPRFNSSFAISARTIPKIIPVNESKISNIISPLEFF